MTTLDCSTKELPQQDQLPYSNYVVNTIKALINSPKKSILEFLYIIVLLSIVVGNGRQSRHATHPQSLMGLYILILTECLGYIDAIPHSSGLVRPDDKALGAFPWI